MKEKIVSNTFKSIVWSALERFSVQVLQFLISIILARLVYPSEFGLIALLSIFISIAQSFVESGFSSALIQKNNRTEIDYSTVFYFNVLVSLLLYILLFFAAPLISIYYHNPVLELLCKWMGLGIIIQSFSIVIITKLTVNLDFKTQAKASLSAVIISGSFGVYLAYNDYGVWALLIQYLVNTLLNTVFLWWLSPWFPLPKFSYNSLKYLFPFGVRLLLAGILHSVYMNLYSLVIGRKYTVMDVGYFSQASLVARLPSVSLMAVISRAIYPIQCKINDDDSVELSRDLFIKYLRIASFVIFPIMIGLAVLSKSLILIFLSDRWLPMSEYLFILSITYIWIPLLVMNNQMLLVNGRTDLFLKSESLKKIVGLLILVLSMPYGIAMLCYGLLVYNLIEVAIVIYFSKKVFQTGFLIQFKAIRNILLSAISMGVIMYFILLLIDDVYFELIVGVLVGILFYSFLSSMLRIKEFSDFRHLIRSARRSS